MVLYIVGMVRMNQIQNATIVQLMVAFNVLDFLSIAVLFVMGLLRAQISGMNHSLSVNPKKPMKRISVAKKTAYISAKTVLDVSPIPYFAIMIGIAKMTAMRTLMLAKANVIQKAMVIIPCCPVTITVASECHPPVVLSRSPFARTAKTWMTRSATASVTLISQE